MTRTHVLFVAAVLIALALWALAPEAEAQDDARGWTVIQNGESVDYPETEWKVDFGSNSVKLTNAKTFITETYYGTFRVIQRKRS